METHSAAFILPILSSMVVELKKKDATMGLMAAAI